MLGGDDVVAVLVVSNCSSLGSVFSLIIFITNGEEKMIEVKVALILSDERRNDLSVAHVSPFISAMKKQVHDAIIAPRRPVRRSLPEV